MLVDQIKNKTVGVIDLEITERAEGHNYIHVVNKNNGREGEVWGPAAILLEKKADELPAAEFEQKLSMSSMSFMGGDISSSILEVFQNA